jgi:hypothetical protein
MHFRAARKENHCVVVLKLPSVLTFQTFIVELCLKCSFRSTFHAVSMATVIYVIFCKDCNLSSSLNGFFISTNICLSHQAIFYSHTEEILNLFFAFVSKIYHLWAIVLF